MDKKKIGAYSIVAGFILLAAATAATYISLNHPNLVVGCFLSCLIIPVMAGVVCIGGGIATLLGI